MGSGSSAQTRKIAVQPVAENGGDGPKAQAEAMAVNEPDAKLLNDFDVGGVTPPMSVAAWLGATPPAGSPVQQALERCFPGAVPGCVVLQRAVAALRQFGLNPENTIYGQSICPDEINNEKGDLASLMQDHWGKCFPMGGIGGAPYVGQTGFMAFSHHVPEGGHVLILFGPHVAISETGELGKYLRVGQAKHSSACGAVLAAYQACCAGTAAGDDPLDMQQNWLKNKVAQVVDKVRAAPEPVAAVTFAAYEAIQEKLISCVNHSYGTGKLVLIGGIQINMPGTYEDHFCPMMFRVSDNASEPQDLLSAFRYEPPPAPAGLSRQASLASEAITNKVFGWLDWAPDPCEASFQSLHEAFPGAVPGQVVLRRAVLSLRRFGLEPGNTIYGQSICPDEINNEKGDLAYIMKDYWGSCFPMGGIGGAPYVGKTGFMAFSHHVPDNGNVLILFGPHVAISATGELGKYLRLGQKQHSGACGAILAAYSACCSGQTHDNEALDMQQTWLYQQVAKNIDKIKAAQHPVAAVTHEAYEAAKEKMFSIMNHDFGSGYLVLIGGIQINMPQPYEDQFQPLCFRISNKAGASYDLLSDFAVVR